MNARHARISFVQESARNVVRLLRGLFIGVLLARHLGPEQFGIYAYATTLVVMLIPLLSMGTDGLLIREFTRNGRSWKLLMRQGTLARLIGFALILTCIVTFFLIQTQTRETGIIVAIMLCAAAAEVLRVKQLRLQADGRFQALACTDIVATIVGAVIVIVGIVNDWAIWAFALALAVDAWVLTLLVIFTPERERSSSSSPHISFANLLREGLPYLLASGAVMVYMRVDLIMLAEIKGDREAGLYQAAVRAVEVSYLAPIALYRVLLPRLQAQSPEQFRQAFVTSLRNMGRLGLVVILLGLLLGVPAFPLVYSDQYAAATWVFALMLPTCSLMGTGLLATALVIRESTGWQSFWVALAAAIVNVLLNVILIPAFGMFGAAIATNASLAVVALFIFAAYRDNRWALMPALRSLIGL